MRARWSASRVVPCGLAGPPPAWCHAGSLVNVGSGFSRTNHPIQSAPTPARANVLLAGRRASGRRVACERLARGDDPLVAVHGEGGRRELEICDSGTRVTLPTGITVGPAAHHAGAGSVCKRPCSYIVWSGRGADGSGSRVVHLRMRSAHHPWVRLKSVGPAKAGPYVVVLRYGGSCKRSSRRGGYIAAK